MRVLIMCGGDDLKWTEKGGTSRRHFQVVGSETVLERLVRQLRARGATDIGIICPDLPGYDLPGTYRVPVRHPEWGHEGLNGQHLWHESERTLYVYGDMIFADRAMDVVVGFTTRTFQMFGRFGNGVIKGGGGELFAFSFWPEHREAWHDALELAFALKARGIIRRAGSWEAYRIMGGARGIRVGLHRYYPAVFTNINDRQTDDFDTPPQFEKLLALHGLTGSATMAPIE